MLFSIINPSDPYTMRASELEVAAVAIGALSYGEYGLEEISGDRSGQVPIFLTDGHDAWYMKQFGRTFEQSVNYVMTERFDEMIKALTSVHIGTPADKAAFDERAKQCPDEEALVELLHELHDAKRTSMNDIGRQAWSMAEALVEQRQVKQAIMAEAQVEADGAVKQ